jgi:malonate-semialdehyde dehydrogenase (acetylating)/methylmalonate-semialdehyde dehydrogenase
MNTIGHFINGPAFNEASRSQKVFNPATGESNSEVAIANKKRYLMQ